jgi:hypothetical protein
MTFRYLRNFLKQKSLTAIKMAAEQAKTEIRNYIPIDQGTLQDSLRIVEEGGSIFLRTGYKGRTPYVAAQYFEEKRHRGQRGDYQRLADLGPGADFKPGSGKKALYNSAYKEHKDKLGKSTPEWYEPILKDKKIQKRMANIYAGIMNQI